MNQILDIAGSYVIGGLVLIMILSMMYFFSEQKRDTVYQQVSQYNLMEVGNILNNDFNMIGYGMTSSDGNKLVSLSSNSIKFRGDMGHDNVIDSVEYSVIQKNNLQYLQRREYSGNINNTTVWDFPVKSFEILAYTNSGDTTTNTALVKNFLVKIETVNNDVDTTISQNNVGSSWQRQIYPQNL